jgi:Spy/CpxP family protein refolding chaperone
MKRKEDTMKTGENRKERISRGFLFMILAVALVITGLGLITQPFSAEARGPFGPPKSPDQIMERLTDRLDLTDEQAEAIRPIIEEKVRKMNEIRGESRADRRAARTEIRKLRWDTAIKLDEILTDEQIEKYIELRQEQRDKRHWGKFRGNKMGKGFNKTPDEVIARLTDRFDLTEEQAAAIEPIIKESIAKKRVIFDKYGEKRWEVREAMRNELRAAGDETEAELSTVLTDEQIEDLRSFREQKRAWMDKRMNRPGPMGF